MVLAIGQMMLTNKSRIWLKHLVAGLHVVMLSAGSAAAESLPPPGQRSLKIAASKKVAELHSVRSWSWSASTRPDEALVVGLDSNDGREVVATVAALDPQRRSFRVKFEKPWSVTVNTDGGESTSNPQRILAKQLLTDAATAIARDRGARASAGAPSAAPLPAPQGAVAAPLFIFDPVVWLISALVSEVIDTTNPCPMPAGIPADRLSYLVTECYGYVGWCAWYTGGPSPLPGGSPVCIQQTGECVCDCIGVNIGDTPAACGGAPTATITPLLGAEEWRSIRSVPSGQAMSLIKARDGVLHALWAAAGTPLLSRQQRDGLFGLPELAWQARGAGRMLAAALERTGRIGVLMFKDQRIWFSKSLPTPGRFEPFVPLAAGAKSGPIVAKNADGRLELFYFDERDGMSQLYQTLPELSWSGPHPFADGIYPGAAQLMGDGRLAVLGRNSRSELMLKTQVAPNSGWSEWKALGGPSERDVPVMATNADGRLEIFALRNGRLLHSWESRPSTSDWSSWVEFPDLPVANYAVARNVDGRIAIVVRQPGGELMETSQNLPNQDFGEWRALAGEAGSIQALAEQADGRLVLVVTPPRANRSEGWRYRKQVTPGLW